MVQVTTSSVPTSRNTTTTTARTRTRSTGRSGSGSRSRASTNGDNGNSSNNKNTTTNSSSHNINDKYAEMVDETSLELIHLQIRDYVVWLIEQRSSRLYHSPKIRGKVRGELLLQAIDLEFPSLATTTNANKGNNDNHTGKEQQVPYLLQATQHFARHWMANLERSKRQRRSRRRSSGNGSGSGSGNNNSRRHYRDHQDLVYQGENMKENTEKTTSRVVTASKPQKQQQQQQKQKQQHHQSIDTVATSGTMNAAAATTTTGTNVSSTAPSTIFHAEAKQSSKNNHRNDNGNSKDQDKDSRNSQKQQRSAATTTNMASRKEDEGKQTKKDTTSQNEAQSSTKRKREEDGDVDADGKAVAISIPPNLRGLNSNPKRSTQGKTPVILDTNAKATSSKSAPVISQTQMNTTGTSAKDKDTSSVPMSFIPGVSQAHLHHWVNLQAEIFQEVRESQKSHSFIVSSRLTNKWNHFYLKGQKQQDLVDRWHAQRFAPVLGAKFEHEKKFNTYANLCQQQIWYQMTLSPTWPAVAQRPRQMEQGQKYTQQPKAPTNNQQRSQSVEENVKAAPTATPQSSKTEKNSNNSPQDTLSKKTDRLIVATVQKKSKNTMLGITLTGSSGGGATPLTIRAIHANGLFAATKAQVGMIVETIQGKDMTHASPKEAATLLREIEEGDVTITGHMPPK